MPTTQCICGVRYKFPSGAEGRKARCKKCGEVFRIADGNGPIPMAESDGLTGGGAGLAETGSNSMIEGQTTVSTAMDPDRGDGTALPRLRPRTGFWADIAWVILFFANPTSLVMFLVAWAMMGFRWLVGFTPLVGWFFQLCVTGYIIGWYMSIIPETASGEDDLPSFSGDGGLFEDSVKPALAYCATYVVLMIPAVVYALLVVEALGGVGVVDLLFVDVGSILESGSVALVPLFALVFLGLFFWPIALMCVSMGGFWSILRIDLLLIAVVRTLPAYTLIFAMVVAATLLPGLITEAISSRIGLGGGLSRGAFITAVASSAVGVYFWIVTMQLIGLYYRHFKRRFPWDWE
ncbi:MAG: DUF4013 domain-containing protein [bacterium]|nr:DUF4013 domain-containing protein [bacterium]